MDRQQPLTPPTPNQYPPNAPWPGATGAPPYPQQGGPTPGYPGGPWPPPPLQPPPRPPMQSPPKRHTGAIFASLGVVFVLVVAVALVVVTGAASRLTGKSATTTTTSTNTTVSTMVAQVPAVSGQTMGTTAPATMTVPGTAVATGSRDLSPVAGTPPATTARSTARPAATAATTAVAGEQATLGSKPTVKPAPPATLATSPAIANVSGMTATVDISKTQVHGLNQPVNVSGWTVTVTKVERPGTELTWNSDNDPATASGTWVVVVVTMKKTANGTDGATTDAFTVRTGQGFADPVPDDYWMQLGMYAAFTHTQPFSKSVPPGATVTYNIPFDVATDATDLRLVFTTDTATSAVFAL